MLTSVWSALHARTVPRAWTLLADISVAVLRDTRDNIVNKVRLYFQKCVCVCVSVFLTKMAPKVKITSVKSLDTTFNNYIYAHFQM